MKNKGMTVIELIILLVVICGITILMYPIISDYIWNCRMNDDMKTAKEIAIAMEEALSDKKMSENAVEHATPQLVSDMDGSDFKKTVYSKLDLEEIKGKSKKDVAGEEIDNTEFYYTLNIKKKRVEIYYGGITEEYRIYPKAGKKLVNHEN